MRPAGLRAQRLLRPGALLRAEGPRRELPWSFDVAKARQRASSRCRPLRRSPRALPCRRRSSPLPPTATSTRSQLNAAAAINSPVPNEVAESGSRSSSESSQGRWPRQPRRPWWRRRPAAPMKRRSGARAGLSPARSRALRRAPREVRPRSLPHRPREAAPRRSTPLPQALGRRPARRPGPHRALEGIRRNQCSRHRASVGSRHVLDGRRQGLSRAVGPFELRRQRLRAVRIELASWSSVISSVFASSGGAPTTSQS